jgi:hypothetical protein
MAHNDLELVSQFCSNSENPFLYTLPKQFCTYDVLCEELLRNNMLKVAKAVDLGHQMERRLERDAVAVQMPPAQFAAEKGSMRSQSNYEYI